MKIETRTVGNTVVAAVFSEEVILTDVQSALDLIMTVKYETGCYSLAINKEAVTEEFFVLSTKLAGEVLQKFINYGFKFAIYGDYSKYTSKPLKDFIYECNKGKDIFFAVDLEDAVNRLEGVTK